LSIDAMVVLFPDPVTPANSTIPWSYFEVRDEVVDATSHHADASQLLQHVDAETPVDSIDINGVGEVRAPFFFKDAPMPRAEHRNQKPHHFFVFDRGTIERPEVAVDAYDWGAANLHVKVARYQLDRCLEDLVYFQFLFGGKQRTG
jgi:hypothetical protein